MNNFESQTQQNSMKRRWQNTRLLSPSSSSSNPSRFPCLDDDDLVSTVIPLVTVVLEGRSICQRISLQKHASYQSLAKALRQMFVDGSDDGGASETDLDLSNAVPGHLIAYEDMENDLLLAGDLKWKDFVRVAKRIRILPAKERKRRDLDGSRTSDFSRVLDCCVFGLKRTAVRKEAEALMNLLIFNFSGLLLFSHTTTTPGANTHTYT